MKVAFLDLLCNGIGAMFLLMVVLASRHYTRPEVPERGLIVVEVSTPDPRAKLGIWLRNRSKQTTFVNEQILNYPQGTPIAPGRDVGVLAPRGSFYNLFLKEEKGMRAAMSVIDPQSGCYEIGVFLQDYDNPSATPDSAVKVQYHVWFRQPLRANSPGRDVQTPAQETMLLAPTSSIRLPLTVGDESNCPR